MKIIVFYIFIMKLCFTYTNFYGYMISLIGIPKKIPLTIIFRLKTKKKLNTMK